MPEDDLRETGRAVGHVIQETIATNRSTTPLRGSRRPDERPRDAETFRRFGGMRKLEHDAARQAVDEAIYGEREYWLPQLEAWLAQPLELPVRTFLNLEVKRLRRLLVRQIPDQMRAKGKGQATSS